MALNTRLRQLGRVPVKNMSVHDLYSSELGGEGARGKGARACWGSESSRQAITIICISIQQYGTHVHTWQSLTSIISKLLCTCRLTFFLRGRDFILQWRDFPGARFFCEYEICFASTRFYFASTRFFGECYNFVLLVPLYGLLNRAHELITLIRAHGLLNRAHGLVSHAHGLLSRAHGLLNRAHGLVIRAHGLVIRAHGLA